MPWAAIWAFMPVKLALNSTSWTSGRASAAGAAPAAGEPAAPNSSSALLATWRMAGDAAALGRRGIWATAYPKPGWAPARPRVPGSALCRDQVARGAITLPAVVDPEMVDGVVWLPSRAPGLGIPKHLAASAGDLVTIGPGVVDMRAELDEASPSTGAVLGSSKGAGLSSSKGSGHAAEASQ